MRRASLVGLAGAVVAASAAGSADAAPPWSEPRSVGAATGTVSAATIAFGPGGTALLSRDAGRLATLTPGGRLRRAPAAVRPTRRSSAAVRAWARRAPPRARALRGDPAACPSQRLGGLDRDAGGPRPAAPARDLHDVPERWVAGDGGRPAGPDRDRVDDVEGGYGGGAVSRAPGAPSAERPLRDPHGGVRGDGPDRRLRPTRRGRRARSPRRRRRRVQRRRPVRSGSAPSGAAAALAAPQALGPQPPPSISWRLASPRVASSSPGAPRTAARSRTSHTSCAPRCGTWAVRFGPAGHRSRRAARPRSCRPGCASR